MSRAADLELCEEVARSCPAIALTRATRKVERVFAEAFDGLEIGGRQFSLLVALSRLGTVPIARLATIMDLAPATLSRNLGRLERRGIVALERGEDRRQQRVTLTTKGREQLSKALVRWRDGIAELEAALGTTKLEELRALLQHVGRSL